MKPFEALRVMRDFQKEHFPYIQTPEDYDILREIGWHEEAGRPIRLRELLRMRIATVATVRRRLLQLKAAGVVEQRRLERDYRAYELVLSRKASRSFSEYHKLLGRVGKPAR